MQATTTLMNEHRLIEQVLACLECMADGCAEDGVLDAELAHDAVWFLRTFADRCHHGKEEAELFPLMEVRGFTADAGPTAVMRMEHDRGRELVGRVDAAIDAAARGEQDSIANFIESSRTFIALLREHIRKEDHCLFPMADSVLTDHDRATLEQHFERVDNDEIGRDILERCHRTADNLAVRFGVPRAHLEFA